MAQTVWRGHLTFGLVSFPVRLYKAARPQKVQLHRLYRPAAPPPPPVPETPAPSGRRGAASHRERLPEPPPPPPEPEVFRTHNRIVAPSAPPPAPAPASRRDEPTPEPDFDFDEVAPPSGQLVKGYEYDKGRYVVLEDEELKSLNPETSKEMQILEFVHLDEIDPIYFETSYYVTPDEAGQRPYGLLYEALKESAYVGLAQVAMHRREHIVVIRPGPKGIIAHTMFFAEEIRGDEEYRAPVDNLNPRELDLAKKLIETMAVSFDPAKFRDTYRERLDALIAAKVAGKEVARETTAAPKAAQVVDIFDALQRSLAAMKKPAERATASAPPAATKRRARKAS